VAVPIPAAIPRECQIPFLEAESLDEDLEGEEGGLWRLLAGAVEAAGEADASGVVGSSGEVEEPECRAAVDCP
jgi:hypothetical protein